MDPRNTLHALLVEHAGARANAVALRAPGRPPLRYGELSEQILRIGGWLAAAGVEPGDRVAIALPNGPELAVAVLGVATFMPCAPLHPMLSEREFHAAFEGLRVDWLILEAASAGAAHRAADTAGVRCIHARGDNALPAGAFVPASPSALRGIRAGGRDDVALLLQTSGTTSRPKRVPLTQTQLCRSAANIAATLTLTSADCCLNIMPLFHVHGLVGALLASLHAGASVVCTPGLRDGRFAAWLREFEPTWYTAVPTMHQAIVREFERLPREALPPRLRFARSASAALPPSVAASLEKALGAPVVEAYGMTEAAHQVTSNPLPPLPRIAGSVGIAAGPEVAIMDSAGNLLPARTLGEVVIRGANVIEGYDAAPDINATAFTDGWLRTGDQGWLDEDGYLRVTGRLKELINRGGEKISPREVEEALLEQPGIAECAVFAVPHPTLGEDVTAAVVVTPGVAVDTEALRRSLFGRLSDTKIPSRVVAVAALPKGPTGKLQRVEIAERLAAQLAATFVPPSDDIEAHVASIYAQVLGIERVGATDNFFALGGDSLRGGQLLSRLQARFGVSLTIATLFRRPTPAQIAGEVANAVPATDASLPLLLARVEALIDEEARAASADEGRALKAPQGNARVDAADALGFARIDPSGGDSDDGNCALTDRDVDVWAFSLAAQPGDVERWLPLLTEDECDHAGRFERAADRDAYIVAHGVLRRLLAGYCSTAPDALRFARTAGGKPMLEMPPTARTIHFNLAHCGNRALLAVGREEVGVDLEVEREDIDTRALANQFFSCAEREVIAGARDALRVETFFRHWVAKEATLKAHGTGLAHPLDAFAIRFSADGNTATVAASDATTIRSDWQVCMLRLPRGWYGALCAPRDCRMRLRTPACGARPLS